MAVFLSFVFFYEVFRGTYGRRYGYGYGICWAFYDRGRWAETGNEWDNDDTIGYPILDFFWVFFWNQSEDLK